MKRIRAAPAALAIAATLPFVSGCWWLESEPGPGEWRIRNGTIGDFQPHNVASLYEAAGSSQLVMECGEGPIQLRIRSDRDRLLGDLTAFPARYRLDGHPPVSTPVVSSGTNVWFRHPARGTGEDPMVARIAGARQLTVRVDWSPTDRQTLHFDVSRAGGAIERLRRDCAEDASRKRTMP